MSAARPTDSANQIPEPAGHRPPHEIRPVRPVKSEEAASAETVMRTCPICGSELAERKCKLYCPRPGCGYFLSCADFY